jgi:hypothetical protein
MVRARRSRSRHRSRLPYLDFNLLGTSTSADQGGSNCGKQFPFLEDALVLRK